MSGKYIKPFGGLSLTGFSQVSGFLENPELWVGRRFGLIPFSKTLHVSGPAEELLLVDVNIRAAISTAVKPALSDNIVNIIQSLVKHQIMREDLENLVAVDNVVSVVWEETLLNDIQIFTDLALERTLCMLKVDVPIETEQLDDIIVFEHPVVLNQIEVILTDDTVYYELLDNEIAIETDGAIIKRELLHDTIGIKVERDVVTRLNTVFMDIPIKTEMVVALLYAKINLFIDIPIKSNIELSIKPFLTTNQIGMKVADIFEIMTMFQQVINSIGIYIGFEDYPPQPKNYYLLKAGRAIHTIQARIIK